MIEIELSLMENNLIALSELRQLLITFEAQQNIRVKLRMLNWGTAWTEIVNYALHRQGPDVSEIGSTWVGSLASMNALRPFQLSDIGESWGFIPSVWSAGLLPGDKTLWAMPWLADTRIIYYRRDLFAEAGIDPQTAFQSADSMAQALSRLPLNSPITPWMVPTQITSVTVHNIAAWVWAAGGDFVDPLTKEVLFNRPEARAGLSAYFSLRQYITAKARGLDDSQANALFQRGEAAATVSGSWLYMGMASPVPDETIGAALPPGPPFIGGTNLAIWQHVNSAQRERAAVALVQFLTSQPVQSTYSIATGQLPVRLEVLNDEQFTRHPIYQVIVEALRQGRSFPTMPFWASVEDKLKPALDEIWTEVLANPLTNVEAVVGKHMEATAKRLEVALNR